MRTCTYLTPSGWHSYTFTTWIAVDTTRNCRLPSWTLHKSADCRWISITILYVSFTNSATVRRLEQVQLCNRLIDQSADNITGLKCAKECLILKYKYIPRKFKRGIGSLFDPVLTLLGGGHIGSSRMEQSYCTSGFFRQRVTARNHSNYQPTPRCRSIIAYGKRENARRDKCVAVCVICFFFFFSCSVLRFPNFPG